MQEDDIYSSILPQYAVYLIIWKPDWTIAFSPMPYQNLFTNH